jgi:hypothetical protein
MGLAVRGACECYEWRDAGGREQGCRSWSSMRLKGILTHLPHTVYTFSAPQLWFARVLALEWAPLDLFSACATAKARACVL